MVARCYFKCNICDSVTMVRIDVVPSSYPVRYTCIACSSSTRGNVEIHTDSKKSKVIFDNCVEVKNTQAEYYFEISNYLLTEKVRKFNKNNDEHRFSMFFKNLEILGLTEYKNQSIKVYEFEKKINHNWHKIRSCIELYLNGKGQLISTQIHQLLPKKIFPCNNDFEIMRATHNLILNYTMTIFQETYENDICNKLTEEWFNTVISKNEKYFELVNFLEDGNYLLNSEKKIFKLIDDFCKIYNNIKPIILLSLSGKDDYSKIRNEYGLSTCDFEDLKSFYLDSYEFLADSLIITTLHNNLKHRNEYRQFNQNKKNVDSLEKYFKLTKGERIQLSNQKEFFDYLVYEPLDNKIRNSIGHNNFEYCGKSQYIRFIDQKNPNNSKGLYLIEFALICYKNFISVINISELIYHDRKIKYMLEGQTFVDPKIYTEIH